MIEFDDMEHSGLKKSLTVGDVSRRAGVAVSTVHFYETKGLIEGWRTEGNQRRYHRAVLRRIAIIKIAQRAGIPLAIIREAPRRIFRTTTCRRQKIGGVFLKPGKICFRNVSTA